jgi:hypothetical protein
MNDLEHEIRETLRHHESDAPTFDSSDARRAAARTRRRQIVNVTGVGLGTLVIVIGFAVGLSGLVRADRSPTVLDTPSPSQTSVPTRGPNDQEVHGWPGGSRNPAGVYSWGDAYSYMTRVSAPDGSRPKKTISSRDQFIHNAYKPGSGDLSIIIEGDAGRLIPHRGETPATVAGYEGTYRRFIGEDEGWMNGLPTEEWMVDIQGTTVTILLLAEPGAPQAELDEAHEIIRSMYVDPDDDDLGFRLIFTLRTNTWDSG